MGEIRKICKLKVKSRLVARGFQEDTSNVLSGSYM